MVDRIDVPDPFEPDDDLVGRLRSVSVRPTGIDRERLMYLTGRAEARQEAEHRLTQMARANHVWKCVCAMSCMATIMTWAFAWPTSGDVPSSSNQVVVQPTTDPPWIEDDTLMALEEVESPGRDISPPEHTPGNQPVQAAVAPHRADVPPGDQGTVVGRRRQPASGGDTRFFTRTAYVAMCERIASDGLNTLPPAPRHVTQQEASRHLREWLQDPLNRNASASSNSDGSGLSLPKTRWNQSEEESL